MMLFNVFKNTVLFFLLGLISCGNFAKQDAKKEDVPIQKAEPIVGANQTDAYLPLLQGKRVGVVANATSVIFKSHGYTHLVDSLLALQINVVKVFAPEHGFRGTADAGELIIDSKDTKTGLPILSLHGSNKKPTADQMKDLDVMVFDIQDVGVRFYTYISTLHYVMEACAENNVPLIILDRPNPNGHYIDGPVLEPAYKSFVGMDPIPLVHGLTIGEYAQMVNGEGWLQNNVKCDVTIIKVKNYTHQTRYSLPIKPSPNLPNDKAINLYPSLDIFRGTIINVGRGTDFQMQCYGAPFFPKSEFSYTPTSNIGAKHPRFEGELCYGVDLRNAPFLNQFTLKYLIDAYEKTPDKNTFFGPTFDIHAGNGVLKKQIESGMSENAIRKTWKEDLDKYKVKRLNYILYP